MSENIQRAILSTFLWSNDFGMDTDEAFTLDASVFTGDKYLIASKLNEVTNSEDRFFSLLNIELENTSPREWTFIAEQTPLPFSVAKRYYEKLREENKVNIGDRI